MFRVLGRNVIVLHVDKRDMTETGLYLPIPRDNSLMPLRKARVAAVGPDVTLVEKGQTVALNWSEHQAIRSQGREGRILIEEKILGVFA